MIAVGATSPLRVPCPVFLTPELLTLFRCLDLREELLRIGVEVLFAAFAAEIDLGAFVLEGVGLAHAVELFAGDHARVERVISEVQFLLSAGGECHGDGAGDDEFHGVIVLI